MSIFTDFATYEVKLTLKLTLAPTTPAEDFTISLGSADSTFTPVLVAPKEFLPDTRTATKIFPLSITAVSLPELINNTISVLPKSPTSTVTAVTLSLAEVFFGASAVHTTAAESLSLSVLASICLANSLPRCLGFTACVPV